MQLHAVYAKVWFIKFRLSLLSLVKEFGINRRLRYWHVQWPQGLSDLAVIL